MLCSFAIRYYSCLLYTSSGDEGLTIKQISSVLQIGKKEATTYVDELIQVINERAVKWFELVNFGGVFKLITFSSHHEFYQRMIEQNENTLSNAALETLAIIAYNQPVTRVRIEEIRGCLLYTSRCV